MFNFRLDYNRCMKKLLLLLLSLGFLGLANADSNKVINVDGKNVTFPPIQSLVRVDTSSVELFNAIEFMANEVGLHLLDAYFLPEDIDAFMNGELPTFARHVQIKTILNNGKDVPYSIFLEQVEHQKQEALKIEDTLNRANDLLDEQGNFFSNLFEVEIGNVLQYISPQPVFVDNENNFGMSWVYINKQTENGKVIEYGRVITNLAIFINNRILNVAFYSNWSSTKEIAPQELVLKHWLKSFWEANNNV